MVSQNDPTNVSFPHLVPRHPLSSLCNFHYFVPPETTFPHFWDRTSPVSHFHPPTRVANVDQELLHLLQVLFLWHRNSALCDHFVTRYYPLNTSAARPEKHCPASAWRANTAKMQGTSTAVHYNYTSVGHVATIRILMFIEYYLFSFVYHIVILIHLAYPNTSRRGFTPMTETHLCVGGLSVAEPGCPAINGRHKTCITAMEDHLHQKSHRSVSYFSPGNFALAPEPPILRP